ncbi:MAG: hypothetical protein KC547_03185 [Anaerolineae bacterium]|nr:hypothetical protein [Anaerolineae bacterium]
MQIICLGDSLTWGGYGGNYVDILARLRPEHTFSNAGLGGDTVFNLLRRLERDVLTKAPDGVFVMIGANDAISYLYPATRPYYSQAKRVPEGYITPDQFEQSYRELLSQLQLAHIVSWVGLQPNEYSPDLVEMIGNYNARAASAARVHGIPTIDLMNQLMPEHLHDRPPFTMDDINLIGRRVRAHWHDYETARQRGGFTYTFDGSHPTPAGAGQIAELLADFLAS